MGIERAGNNATLLATLGVAGAGIVLAALSFGDRSSNGPEATGVQNDEISRQDLPVDFRNEREILLSESYVPSVEIDRVAKYEMPNEVPLVHAESTTTEIKREIIVERSLGRFVQKNSAGITLLDPITGELLHETPYSSIEFQDKSYWGIDAEGNRHEIPGVILRPDGLTTKQDNKVWLKGHENEGSPGYGDIYFDAALGLIVGNTGANSYALNKNGKPWDESPSHLISVGGEIGNPSYFGLVGANKKPLSIGAEGL